MLWWKIKKGQGAPFKLSFNRGWSGMFSNKGMTEQRPEVRGRRYLSLRCRSAPIRRKIMCKDSSI